MKSTFFTVATAVLFSVVAITSVNSLPSGNKNLVSRADDQEICILSIIPCPERCRDTCIYPDLPCPQQYPPHCPGETPNDTSPQQNQETANVAATAVDTEQVHEN